MTRLQYHEDGTRPRGKSILVFGSNLAGNHGLGAAALAADKYGASSDVACGLCGRSYALPTKDARLKRLSLSRIKANVAEFLSVARRMPNTTFFMTRVACGYAGYEDKQIAPLFANAPININFPLNWEEFLETPMTKKLKSQAKVVTRGTHVVMAVDGNWLLHRVFFMLRTSRPVEEVLPLNFVGLIMKDACLAKATHILVAFDGPTIFRYKLFPGYKASRNAEKAGEGEDNDEPQKDIYQYLPAVRKCLERAGLAWIQSSKYEADDVLCSAAHQYSALPDVKQVVLDAWDKDGYQSLLPKVVAFSSVEDPPRKINAQYAEHKWGIKREQMVMYQTLTGDPIDDIPQILSPAKAKAACNKWLSFQRWHEKGTDDDRRWLRQNMIALRLNRKLVEMVSTISLPELETLVVPRLTRPEMPNAWHVYQSFRHPKAKSLFGR